MYHRYLQNENGQFLKQRVAAPESKKPKPEIKKTEPPKANFPLPFLKKLLPNMDGGDLLVLLILLLLLSEGNEDSDSVVMTLAIFLFLQ